MIATACPITFDADARARLDQLGMHLACEQLLEHAVKSIPELLRIEVTCPYNEDLGPDQQIVFDAYVSGEPSIEPDLEFGRWKHEHFPPDVAMNFLLMTAHG